MTESQTKLCQNCHQFFTIELDDFAFYAKMAVPPPTFCPECRAQRRLAWRNERAFYKRTCSLCGTSMLALYPAGTPFPVYCRACWYSDRWDARSFGRRYDFARPFFPQFQELLNVVPHIALQQDNCVDCDYANQIADCKNCYLVSSCAGSEDCAFCFRVNDSKDTLDSYTLIKCEQCYELSMGRYSSRVFFSAGAADSLDVYFCDEPRGAQHCFMSTNVRRKSYVFRNVQLTKDEYDRRFGEIDFGSYTTVQQLCREFATLTETAVRPPGTFKNTTNTTGNALANAKNCFHCFHGTDLEDCRYCLFVDRAKDSVDVNNGCCMMERCYECSTTGVNVADIKFSVDAWPGVRNVQYSDSCRSGAHDLFGCISMRGREYCILNEQYPKEQYEQLVLKIIGHMDAMPYADAKERRYAYGEFFPVEMSPFPYSDSSAQDFFPLTKAVALELGCRWNDADARSYSITVRSTELPDRIVDVRDDILHATIECAHGGGCVHQCTTAFRVTPLELAFYRRMNLPLPRLCPNCRLHERIARRNPLKLWKRRCMCSRPGHGHDSTCPVEFETSYAPDRKETVYCESCYNAEVV
jgi:hypothetical protein